MENWIKQYKLGRIKQVAISLSKPHYFYFSKFFEDWPTNQPTDNTTYKDASRRLKRDCNASIIVKSIIWAFFRLQASVDTVQSTTTTWEWWSSRWLMTLCVYRWIDLFTFQSFLNIFISVQIWLSCWCEEDGQVC